MATAITQDSPIDEGNESVEPAAVTEAPVAAATEAPAAAATEAPAAAATEAPVSTEPTFSDLPLRPELLKAVLDLGYEHPTPIQREAIPALVAGRDLLGQAATGTGKTAAFALPILQRLDLTKGGKRRTKALVLTPTRELAVQVSKNLDGYGRALGARTVPIFGGASFTTQRRDMERGVDVVVATPGRALDHIRRGTLDLSQLEMVVLDEADEMLDMGFAEDLDAILSAMPAERQTVLFSATMPSRIETIARTHLTDPVRIRIAREKAVEGEAPKVTHRAYMVARQHKSAALVRVLDVETPAAAIVFCKTRDEVDRLTEMLSAHGHRAEALHGGMSQDQRDRVMGRLRAGMTSLLVATDVAARGLDVDQLTHVVNLSLPTAVESYVHRVGRVGRAGREGVAITFAEPREQRTMKAVERALGQPLTVERVPTAADLRAKRMARTRAAIAARIEQGDLERFRPMVAELADGDEVSTVALAAAALVHEAAGAESDAADIPDLSHRANSSSGSARFERGVRPDRGERSGGRPDRAPVRPGAREALGDGPAEGMTRLFVGIGKAGNVRPGDLVGAITGESPLKGNEVGAIRIQERFSLVEVPEAAADSVVDALRGGTIRGRKATIRRERF